MLGLKKKSGLRERGKRDKAEKKEKGLKKGKPLLIVWGAPNPKSRKVGPGRGRYTKKKSLK